MDAESCRSKLRHIFEEEEESETTELQHMVDAGPLQVKWNVTQFRGRINPWRQKQEMGGCSAHVKTD